MVPVLHLALMLLLSRQVFGYDVVHKVLNEEDVPPSEYHVGGRMDKRFHPDAETQSQLHPLSSFLLKLSLYQSSLSDLTDKSVGVLVASANAESSPPITDYNSHMDSSRTRPFFYSMGSADSGYTSFAPQVSTMSHYVKPRLSSTQSHDSPQALHSGHIHGLFSDSQLPLLQSLSPPPFLQLRQSPPPSHRRHHHKHHYHIPPPAVPSSDLGTPFGTFPRFPPLMPLRGPPPRFPLHPPFPPIPRGPWFFQPPPPPPPPPPPAKHAKIPRTPLSPGSSSPLPPPSKHAKILRSPPPPKSPPTPGSSSQHAPPPHAPGQRTSPPPISRNLTPPAIPPLRRSPRPPAAPNPLSPPPKENPVTPVTHKPSLPPPRRSPPQQPPMPSYPPPLRPAVSPPPVTPKPSPPAAPKLLPPPTQVQPKPISSPPPNAPKPPSPPPPSEDCGATLCLPPLTKTPFMSPCGCVRPIQIRISLTVPLYALFPLISVLAANLAEGTVLSPNQVEIIGANADSQNPDNSVVDVNLVPLDQGFDNLTALIIFERFWKHELLLNSTLFGNYSVVFVQYPGLPPSPPSESASAPRENPVGVVVKTKTAHKLGVGTIAVIALSAAILLVVSVGAVWLASKFHCCKAVTSPVEPGPVVSTRTKRSGARSALSSDLGSSTSLSFSSSMATYTSTARSFSLAELDRATNRFRAENVIGEGGFGRVYSGILDDGTKVAVKVLTRDDQHGGKEFVAEVEMLSRLHHRNLVKLIGICTEEHNRCLVYELIPNGSVDSHLHGADKQVSPLNWEARMKIALGAARGLAYLHEDSNPRVIHRDFKASNILLENDFNPKVSDFGLAKAAPDEGSGHLSTRVMGTFGYVAPEYAMTGHLLVKSDVYSYGVVLLELLSGRKPVDMSQPPGQENLVTWARPLLTCKEGLELLVDPALGNNFQLDNLVRVAAIASMCVQPEVSHRPFMGEVVQALKLVYNDSDVPHGTGSSNDSQLDDSLAGSELRTRIRQGWNEQKANFLPDNTSFVSIDYDSGPSHRGESVLRRPLSASAILSNSARFLRQQSKSFRRHSLSGPLGLSRSRLANFEQRRGNKQGSISEHAKLSRRFSSG